MESDPDTMMLKYQGEVYEATFLNDDSVEVQPFGGTLSSAESHGEEDTIKQALEQANYESEVEMEPVTIS